MFSLTNDLYYHGTSHGIISVLVSQNRKSGFIWSAFLQRLGKLITNNAPGEQVTQKTKSRPLVTGPFIRPGLHALSLRLKWRDVQEGGGSGVYWSPSTRAVKV